MKKKKGENISEETPTHPGIGGTPLHVAGINMIFTIVDSEQCLIIGPTSLKKKRNKKTRKK